MRGQARILAAGLFGLAAFASVAVHAAGTGSSLLVGWRGIAVVVTALVGGALGPWLHRRIGRGRALAGIPEGILVVSIAGALGVVAFVAYGRATEVLASDEMGMMAQWALSEGAGVLVATTLVLGGLAGWTLGRVMGPREPTN